MGNLVAKTPCVELTDNDWTWPILSFLSCDIRPNLVQLHTLEIPNAKLGITWILDFINELKFQQLQPLNMIKSPTVRLISLCQCWQQTQIVNSAWEIYYFHLCKYTLHREHQSQCIKVLLWAISIGAIHSMHFWAGTVLKFKKKIQNFKFVSFINLN